TDGLPRRPNIEQYVRIVRDKAVKRFVAHQAETIGKDACNGSTPVELAQKFLATGQRIAEYCLESGARITRLEQIPDPFSLDAGEFSWHVPGLIPARAVTVLAGEAGAGKTSIALALARSVTVGGEFLGRPVGRVEVLYL